MERSPGAVSWSCQMPYALHSTPGCGCLPLHKQAELTAMPFGLFWHGMHFTLT